MLRSQACTDRYGFAVLGTKPRTCFSLVFQDRFLCVALSVLDHHSADQTDLQLRDSPAFAFQVLGLEACPTASSFSLELCVRQAFCRSSHPQPSLYSFTICSLSSSVLGARPHASF